MTPETRNTQRSQMKTAIPCIVFALCIVLAPAAHGQIEDVTLHLRSGRVLEGDVVASGEDGITFAYTRHYGYSGEYSTDVQEEIPFDSLRTVIVEGQSSAAGGIFLGTLVATGLGLAAVTSEGNAWGGGLLVLTAGGLGVVISGIVALSDNGPEYDDHVYSLAIPHDARLLAQRLALDGVVPSTPPSFASRTLRESVPSLHIVLRDGSDFDCWLSLCGDQSVTILVSEESLVDRGEHDEIREIPFDEIDVIEGQPFVTEEHPFQGEWRPGEQSVDALRIYSFSHVSRSMNEQPQRPEGN